MARKSPSSLKVLVVDDEAQIRKTLALCLEDDGHKALAVGSVEEALRTVTRESFDAAFLDLRLDTDSGLDLIPRFLEQNPLMGIVVITAYASIETAVEAMKRGASDYLPKPFTPAQVRLAANKVAERKALKTEVETLKQHVKGNLPDVSLETRNEGMQRVIDLSRQVATGDTTVLFQGESGTGKGVFARAVHAWSPRAANSFSVVHCPSFTTELFESEIFGHTKGHLPGQCSRTPAGSHWPKEAPSFLMR